MTDEDGDVLESALPSLTIDQVFDPKAGIYLRFAQEPQGPWSASRTIFNPFLEETFGYREIMYFADAFEKHIGDHQAAYDRFKSECPDNDATRTAQAWWQEKTEVLSDTDPNSDRSRASLNYGAEYGAGSGPTERSRAGAQARTSTARRRLPRGRSCESRPSRGWDALQGDRPVEQAGP